ncbi:MAG TPA: alpha/beta hydrolase [Candidatus Saccharimonadales bacterium]|nr:alpha/beta hydrolase [Candidatus Saccharimonadales bacterium]
MKKYVQKSTLKSLRQWAIRLGVGVTVALLLLYVSFQVSPWPGALVIRYVFNKGGHKTLVAMEQTLPDYPVVTVANEQYRAGDKDAKLDVYMPQNGLGEQARLPVVVWTHGGAWLSGDKTGIAPYLKRLSQQGYIVVSLNYTLAPSKHYPYQVHQINDAFTYLSKNAGKYHADMQRIVLAGDSAGAQLTAQMAALVTNASYAKQVGVRPALLPDQIAGVVLYCGIYELQGLAEPSPSLPKIIDWGDNTTVWAYAGSRHPSSDLLRQMSPFYHVTSAFPQTFISGGNGDPLTNGQSKPLAQMLQTRNVNVTTLFYPKNHSPQLPHEYQFTFNSDGETAFVKMLSFLQSATRDGL